MSSPFRVCRAGAGGTSLPRQCSGYLACCVVVASAAHFHPGHPMVHTTRLHRYDHRGAASMIEAEAEWHFLTAQPTLPTTLANGHSGFVQLSLAQTAALQHHQRAHLESRQKAEAQRHQWALLDASRAYDNRRVTIDQNHPVVTRLSNLMSQYVGPIGVGTKMTCEKCAPEQQSNIWVVFDTGSTNIWIASDLCKHGPCTMKERHRYNHTESLTYRSPPQPLDLKVRFGTGEVSGPHAVDHIRIGPFTVPNQTFAMIQEQEGQVFQDVPFEGILGLAFPSMSANHVKPFFDTVIDEKSLQHNEFAFYFSKDIRAGNALFWGGVDPAFYKGQIEYFPVTDPYYWALDLHSFQVGDRVLLGNTDVQSSVEHVNGSSLGEGPISSSMAASRVHAHRKHMLRTEPKAEGSRTQKMPKAIIDTGTTYFTAESPMYSQITDLLPSARCGDITQYTHPPITYKLGNAAGTVSAFKFTFEEYMTKAGEGDDAQCHLAFMPIDVPAKHGPGMVLGEVFMRMLYTVFDRGNGLQSSAKVGFAQARHGDVPVRRLAALTDTQEDFGARAASSSS